ncbi:MAG: alpha/beta hydrolase domain-containing protein [Acidobacteriota bacterium]|nr:alpha/beta hydrolase domain-containing protein [Acidobacteriota bacterium]
MSAQAIEGDPISLSGREFMVPSKEVNGQLIGQEDVLIQEVAITDPSADWDHYHRLDIGISGTVDGWAVKENLAMPQLASAPEFLYPQGGITSPRFHGTLRYEAAKGTGMTLVYPEDQPAWNGKLFVTVHGSSGSFKEGTLKPWNQLLDPARPLGDLSLYERLMLDKGYAVAKTRRNASTTGDYSVKLDDGDVLEGWNLNTHTGLLLGFAQLAENILEARLGKRPSRTFWYGHSAGGMTARLINYKPGENLDEDGNAIIDGFLNDDSGGGRYLPFVGKDGRNILFDEEETRQQFIKTIELSHQLFIRHRSRPGVPEWISPVYLTNHRFTARILREKGLGNKFRMYEVKGISHMGDEYLEEGKRNDVTTVRLSRLIDGLIDLLDNWVEKGVSPPATQSALLELGDADGDGINENKAIALPETACPLGVYYPYPPGMGAGGVSWTAFAPFDGRSLEPQDGREVFVDMNLNRYLDHRESVQQAWNRLGLLKGDEKFNRESYRACVDSVVARLKGMGFLTEQAAALYHQQSSEVELPQK